MPKVPPDALKFAEALNAAMPDRKAVAEVLYHKGFLSQQLGVRIYPPGEPARYLVRRGTVTLTVADCPQGQPERDVSSWRSPRGRGWYAKAAVQVRAALANLEKMRDVSTKQETP